MPLALSSSRHRASGTTSRRVTEIAPFVIEPQATPLNKDALVKLKELRNFNQKALNDRITGAFELLVKTAETVNDRGYEERTKFNQRKRKANEEGTDIFSDVVRQYEALQRKVDLVTKKLDTSVRKMVDDRVWLEGVPDMVDHVTSRAKLMPDDSARPVQTQATEDDEPEQNQDSMALSEPRHTETPTALLHAAQTTHNTSWNDKPLTERYADDNDYKGFKRMVWECNHQSENGPPMPHSSLWFATEEGRNTNNNSFTRSQTLAPSQSQNMIDLQSDASDASDLDDALTSAQPQTQEANDSDIEIQAERIRLTCPLTLQPFKEPLTSQKCPHSFERDAILSIIRQSTAFAPLTPSQLSGLDAAGSNPRDRARVERSFPRIPTVQCPECTVQLTEADLRSDPVLKRKVKRHLERQGQDGGLNGNGGGKVVNLGSSPYHSARKQQQHGLQGQSYKNEPSSVSRARNGNGGANGRSRVLDLDEEDEAMDDDEENEGQENSSLVVPQTQLSQRSRGRRNVAYNDEDDEDMYG